MHRFIAQFAVDKPHFYYSGENFMFPHRQRPQFIAYFESLVLHLPPHWANTFCYTKKRRSFDRRFVLALSIFPGRRQPSIVDRNELNYRVRNGNGWTLILISTNSMSSSFPRKQTILYCFASYLSSTKLSFKYRI